MKAKGCQLWAALTLKQLLNALHVHSPSAPTQPLRKRQNMRHIETSSSSLTTPEYQCHIGLECVHAAKNYPRFSFHINGHPPWVCGHSLQDGRGYCAI
eukprot:2114210-Amphidinium_carterae.1